jgi:hypothetical protein
MAMRISVNVRPMEIEIPDDKLFSLTASEAQALIRTRVGQWLESDAAAIDSRFLGDAAMPVAVAA